MRWLWLSAAMASFPSVCPAMQLTVWATHGMDRVMRTSDPRPVLAPIIYAAKGEWEPLQVVAQGLAADLDRLTVVASPLENAQGDIIPPPVILREHYVTVSRTTELSPMATGSYPDALVPLSFPKQTTNSEGTINQPFWLDVYVPPQAAAGDYKGRVTIAPDDGDPRIVDYTLHVWNFSLPKLPAMKSSMFIVWRRIGEIHGFDREANTATPALQRILDAYYDMLVEHRLSPHEVWATYPDASEPLSDKSFQAMDAALKYHLLKRRAGTIGLPLWETWPLAAPLGADREAALDYAARYYRMCDQIGCAGRVYKIFGELDEPHTPAAYAKVRAWRKFFDELKETRGVNIPLLLTVQPTEDNEALQAVASAADILTPHVSALWKDVDGAGALRLTRQHLEKGGQLWAYPALVQAPSEWLVSLGLPKHLYNSHPPVWLTDFPPIHYRMLAWLAPRYGVTGFTYWDTSHFPDKGFDPWENAGTYPHTNGEVYNGDGFLIYPARQDAHGYEGPVASIRLKWLRECVDDYDYLALMMQAGEKSQAILSAATFARSLCDWDDNVPALYAAREDIGRHLEQILNR